MPSRHGQPDPSDETTQQAYYGQHGPSSPPRAPQQGGQPQHGRYVNGPGQQQGQQGPGSSQGYPPPTSGPGASGAQQAPSGQQPGGQAPAKKRKKWPFVVGGVVLLFLIIAIAGGGGGNQGSTPTGGQAAQPSAAAPAQGAGGQSDAPAASAAPAADEGIVYEVTGKGRASNITYSSNGSGGISQQNNARLPFRKQIKSDEGFGFWSLTAQNGQGSGTITCKITKDGEVINENTSEGPYAVVTCTGS